jgi:hypothetical protein
MDQLMLQCPMTDRNFSMGIEADSKALKRVPYTRIAVRCPYCGLEHTWGPRDAPLGQRASATGSPRRRSPAEFPGW